MKQISLYKSVTDIIYEGHDQWWPIRKITPKFLNMSDEDFMDEKKIPLEARNIICEHVRDIMKHVHEAFREQMDAYLLSEPIELDKKFGIERCYKRAMPGDEQYVINSFKRRVRLTKQADYRFDKMLDNAKKLKLLSEDAIKELEEGERKRLKELDTTIKEGESVQD